MTNENPLPEPVTSYVAVKGVVLRHLLDGYVRHVNDFVTVDYEAGKSEGQGDMLLDFLAAEFSDVATPDNGGPDAVDLAHIELLKVIESALDDLTKLKAALAAASPDMIRLKRAREADLAVAEGLGGSFIGASLKKPSFSPM
jgi:hypothetical protein